jgi:hypothetical protein
MQPVPFTAVAIDDPFWAPRLRVNRRTTLATQYRHCQMTGRLAAFRLKWKPGQPNPPHCFWDSDVAKWVEAAAYSLATHPDPALARRLDAVVDLIIRAQQPDGYLNPHYTVVEPGQRWTNLRDGHELYSAGHLIEAAVAHFQATGQRKLLDALCRYADYIGQTFGPDKKRGYCGHEEIELALVKLHRLTGQRRYLDLARYFVDERGRQPHYFDLEARARGEKSKRPPDHSYTQSHLPVREQTRVVGHAVRAMYLYCAMADLAGELGDAALRRAGERLWTHLSERHLYLTGGIGSSRHNEGFTCDYDLPNETAYAETCAAIGLVFWNHRLLQLDGDRRYADLMERALYNGVLSGVALDGQKFFYENPLASTGRHHRQDWFGCACCPPNIARLLASLGQYIYSQHDHNLAVHLYVQSRVELPGLRLRQETNYPWDGRITLHVEPATAARFCIRLRIPAWCRRATLRVNGQRRPIRLQRGYALLTRPWRAGDRVELDLAMPVERIYAHPRVRQNCGRVALQRGPVVYCLEQTDNGPDLNALSLPARSKLTPRWQPKLLGGVVTIQGRALRTVPGPTLYTTAPGKRRPCRITAIPYYAWDNRAPGEMLVWLREQ